MDCTTLHCYKTSMDWCNLCYFVCTGSNWCVVISRLEYVSVMELYAYPCVCVTWTVSCVWVYTDLFRGGSPGLEGILYSGVDQLHTNYWFLNVPSKGSPLNWILHVTGSKWYRVGYFIFCMGVVALWMVLLRGIAAWRKSPKFLARHTHV